MGISSTGIGSGLDVEGIITKLVALEKQPLTSLQRQATVPRREAILRWAVMTMTARWSSGSWSRRVWRRKR